MPITPDQVVGPPTPQSGGPVSRAFGRWILSVAGWSVEGRLPPVSKFVVCVAPHTSNWDFVIGYAARMGVGLRAGWLGKHTLFRGPMGAVFRGMGGIPIDRTASTGVVNQVATAFRESEQLVLGIAPEGTRRKVTRWKTGFYHIAVAAEVPIVPVALDWGAKTLRIGEPFLPSGDIDADLPALERFFVAARGKVPGNAYPAPV